MSKTEFVTLPLTQHNRTENVRTTALDIVGERAFCDIIC